MSKSRGNAVTLAADADEAVRYADADLAPPADANEIDAAAMARVVEALNVLRFNDPDALGDWFGRFITRYRSADVVAADEPPRSRIEIEWSLDHEGGELHRHPHARVAWRRAADGGRLYVSGHDFMLPVADAQAIAGSEAIDGGVYAALSPAGRDALHELLAGGFFQWLPPDAQE